MPTLDLAPPPKSGDDTLDRWLTRLYQQVQNLTPKPIAWSPILSCDTVGDLAVSYSVQQGRYWSIGLFVIAQFRIVTSAFTYTTASGTARIKGLPYTSANITNEISTGGAISWGGITKASYTDVSPTVPANDNKIALSTAGSGQTAANLAITDFPTAGTVTLRGVVFYPTA